MCYQFFGVNSGVFPEGASSDKFEGPGSSGSLCYHNLFCHWNIELCNRLSHTHTLECAYCKCTIPYAIYSLCHNQKNVKGLTGYKLRQID